DPVELDYPAAVAAALHDAEIDAAPAAVRHGIEAEYRSWAPARHVHPDTPALLDGVRALGLRSAVAATPSCSPARWACASRIRASSRPWPRRSASTRARRCSWATACMTTSS